MKPGGSLTAARWRCLHATLPRPHRADCIVHIALQHVQVRSALCVVRDQRPRHHVAAVLRPAQPLQRVEQRAVVQAAAVAKRRRKHVLVEQAAATQCGDGVGDAEDLAVRGGALLDEVLLRHVDRLEEAAEPLVACAT